MSNLNNIVYISNEDFEVLVTTGSVTIGGVTHTYDPNNLYITPDDSSSDNSYLPLSGGTLTGTLNVAGTDVVLGTASSSSNDSGDIVFKYGNGQEKLRIWSSDTYSSGDGPNYRVYNDAGTQLYSGRLATLNDLSQSNLTSQLGLGNVGSGWGTVTSGNGYDIRWGCTQAGGGSFVFGEKNGQTSFQVDGQIYVNEGQNRLIHTGEIDSYIASYLNNHTYNGSYS